MAATHRCLTIGHQTLGPQSMPTCLMFPLHKVLVLHSKVQCKQSEDNFLKESNAERPEQSISQYLDMSTTGWYNSLTTPIKIATAQMQPIHAGSPCCIDCCMEIQGTVIRCQKILKDKGLKSNQIISKHQYVKHGYCLY